MFTRRTLATSSLAGLLTLNGGRRSLAAAQTPEAATPVPAEHDWWLDFQGSLGYKNMPDLPTAPDGECAIVMQAVSNNRESVAAVYHNASDEVMTVQSVTAEYIPPEGGKNVAFEPENTNFGPHTLQPGEYGIACPAFGWKLDEEGEVVVELDVVPEAEAGQTYANLAVLRIDVQPAADQGAASVSVHMINLSEHTLAVGHGLAGIFFTEDGEILDWFNRSIEFEMKPRGERYINFASTNLQTSDSLLVVFGGRIVK